MPDINVRIGEGCAPDVNLLWDTVWNPVAGVGDWAVAGPSETLNRGGLQATAALATAVILCLFTDKACPTTHPLYKFVDGDPRGWWGDGIDVRADLGETPLGSLLWLLERAALDEVETPRWAEAFAYDALQTLVSQRAVAAVEVKASLDPSPSRLNLEIKLYGQNGTLMYARRFQNIWAQLGRGP